MSDGGWTTLYRFYGRDGRLLYVGIAADWERRLKEHQASPWFRTADSLALVHYRDRRSARTAEREAIREEWPLWNVDQSPWAPVTRQMNKLADPTQAWIDKGMPTRTPLSQLHGAARASCLARIDRQVSEECAHQFRLIRNRTETYA